MVNEHITQISAKEFRCCGINAIPSTMGFKGKMGFLFRVGDKDYFVYGNREELEESFAYITANLDYPKSDDDGDGERDSNDS